MVIAFTDQLHFVYLEPMNFITYSNSAHYIFYSSTKSFSKISFKNKSRRNQWAMSLNILATSILLDRAIYSYGLNNETFVPYCQKYLISNSNSEPIRLGFFINHFIPLLHKLNNCFETCEIAFDLFVNYREDFKLINYE